MGTDVLKSCDSIQNELEKARSQLQGLNDNIRRIIGRDPQPTHLRGDRKRNFNEGRRNDFNNSGGGGNQLDRSRNRESSPTPAKRRPQEAKSVFSRLSGPPARDDDVKPKIYSRVIRELPTRQEIVEAQGTDAESRARNRRMFGCLLGTLQKFCQEESRQKQKEDKKAKIERKLEEQELQERENLKKERQNLFSDRKRQQLEVRKLELKMNYVREFEVWEKSRKDLRNFIRTKSKPHIYYRPKVMTDKTEKKLAECRAELEKELEARRNKMNDDIQAIENRFKNMTDRIQNFASGERMQTDESTTTKHNRRNNEDDDEDSLYGGHSDVEQHVEAEKVKSGERNGRKDRKERHREDDTQSKASGASHPDESNINCKLEKASPQRRTDPEDEEMRNTKDNSNEKHDKSD